MTVVVPTYDRPQALARCLGALAAQDYPRDRFEIVVVDDGGPTPAAAAAERFEGAMRLRVLRPHHAGPAMARNIGAAAAEGELVAFTDDDCAPEPGWIGALANPLAGNPGCAAAGRTVNGHPEDLYSTASELLITYLYEYHRLGRSRTPFFPSNNIAFPSREFLDMGGFSASFRRPGAEDRDICRRWIARGHRFVAAPGAVVRHHHPLSLGRFAEQHFRYGRGAWRLRELARGEGSHDARVEPVAFYLGLVAFPFTAPVKSAAYFSCLLLLTQIAHTSGFLWEAVTARRTDLPAPAARATAPPSPAGPRLRGADPE